MGVRPGESNVARTSRERCLRQPDFRAGVVADDAGAVGDELIDQFRHQQPAALGQPVLCDRHVAESDAQVGLVGRDALPQVRDQQPAPFLREPADDFLAERAVQSVEQVLLVVGVDGVHSGVVPRGRALVPGEHHRFYNTFIVSVNGRAIAALPAAPDGGRLPNEEADRHRRAGRLRTGLGPADRVGVVQGLLGLGEGRLRERRGLQQAEESVGQLLRLQRPPEVGDVAVEVVDQLGHAPVVAAGAPPEAPVVGVAAEEHLQRAGEGLDVAAVPGHDGHDGLGDVALAAVGLDGGGRRSDQGGAHGRRRQVRHGRLLGVRRLRPGVCGCCRGTPGQGGRRRGGPLVGPCLQEHYLARSVKVTRARIPLSGNPGQGRQGGRPAVGLRRQDRIPRPRPAPGT